MGCAGMDSAVQELRGPAIMVLAREATDMDRLDHDPADWRDFEAAAKRPIEQHIRNSFIRTYKPVLDDARYRSFATMEEYRQWCKENLPDWLGYNRD